MSQKIRKFKFNKKHIVLICAILCLILTTILIRITYAQYITSLRTTSNVELGSWLLKVNNQDIIANSDFSNTVTPIFDGSIRYNGANIANLSNPDTINPASVGYITLTIDYSGVSTPFLYKLSFDEPDDPSKLLQDLHVSSYTIDNIDYKYNGNEDIYIAITPDGTKTSQTVLLYITWNDDTNQIMDDLQDTNFSNDMLDIAYDINMEFEQSNTMITRTKSDLETSYPYIIASTSNNAQITSNTSLKDQISNFTGNVIIPDEIDNMSVVSLNEEAFMNSNITTISLPNSITSLGNRVFANCTNLTQIIFRGTISEWENITKPDNWRENMNNYLSIVCSDGRIQY